ncbi:hypothetical protein BJM06_03806 [Enterobacter cloacae]|nr:hypothetical protein BJM06_03806 [Enterobacter cloacae]
MRQIASTTPCKGSGQTGNRPLIIRDVILIRLCSDIQTFECGHNQQNTFKFCQFT